jgi:hypothetical protein
MAHHYDFSDVEFEHQFSTAQLDASLFSHEAHLRLAWIHIRKYGIEQAIKNIRQQIQTYVAQLGASDKYNETVTVAAVRAIYHFMLKSQADNFKDFMEEFPRLKYQFKDLLAAHYETDIFNSADAKEKYLEPELLPFD